MIFMKNRCLLGSLCICILLSVTGCSTSSEVKTQNMNDVETVVLSENNQEEGTQKYGNYEDLVVAV